MRFLVDNQLPVALARSLGSLGVSCEHVLDVGLAEASDAEIWRYAVERQVVLISKDEDFFHLSGQQNAAVQFVWVRLGNCRKQEILAAIERVWPQVHACLEAGDRVVEVR